MKILFILITIAIIAIVIGITSYAAYVVNATDVKYTPTSGSEKSVKAALDDLYTKANSAAQVKYHAGDTVTFSQETFYVLYDVIEGQKFCELFCKNNLKSDSMGQASSSNSTTARAFSKYRYWSYEEQNLNLVQKSVESSCVASANYYAALKGAVGARLLLKSEIEYMAASSIPAVNNMINNGGSTGYWIAQSSSERYDKVYAASLSDGTLSSQYFDQKSYGNRPVLMVLVSKISK